MCPRLHLNNAPDTTAVPLLPFLLSLFFGERGEIVVEALVAVGWSQAVQAGAVELICHDACLYPKFVSNWA